MTPDKQREADAIDRIEVAMKATISAKAACCVAGCTGTDLMLSLDTAYAELEQSLRVMRGGPFDGTQLVI